MQSGLFPFEDDPLKHFIRRDVWLPRCRQRREAIVKLASRRHSRSLKYFTFCAVGALDVLLLDREGIITRSVADEFDTVFFVDIDEIRVSETRKRIPGAHGFPGDFFTIILETPGDTAQAANAQNTRRTREAEQNRAQRARFLSAFPFDVINLDVPRYYFRPKEEVPGKLTDALRTMLQAQRQAGTDSRGRQYTIDEFTLLFTTQVGPMDLPETYLGYLRDTCIAGNLEQHAELQGPFSIKSNGRDVQTFFREDFDGAFKIAVPKSLAELAWEQDWYIDGQRGIEIYQFDRPWAGGTYRMLHLAMTVRRQEPPREHRLPGSSPPEADAAHRQVVAQIFNDDVVAVEGRVAGMRDDLESDLASLFEWRERYYVPPEEEQP